MTDEDGCGHVGNGKWGSRGFPLSFNDHHGDDDDDGDDDDGDDDDDDVDGDDGEDEDGDGKEAVEATWRRFGAGEKLGNFPS